MLTKCFNSSMQRQGAVEMQLIHDSKTCLSSFVPILVVSPHYGEAVFSCGNLLAQAPGSQVLTVCTAPSEFERAAVTLKEERCGFTATNAAMDLRASENNKALTYLNATGIDLGFQSPQHLQGSRTNTQILMADALAATIMQQQPTAVFFPLGLFHDDHIWISDAALSICHHLPTVQWFVYLEIRYAAKSPSIVNRLSFFGQRGLAPMPFCLELKKSKKPTVQAYRSELQGMSIQEREFVIDLKERFWQLHAHQELLA